MKLSAISLLMLSSIAFSSNAFAISDESLAAKCLSVGKAKIAEQAQVWSCSVDTSKVEAVEVDNRFYNPSKYVWYKVAGECNGLDGLVKMVQYSGGKCF